jgi:hypothetical protein
MREIKRRDPVDLTEASFLLVIVPAIPYRQICVNS